MRSNLPPLERFGVKRPLRIVYAPAVAELFEKLPSRERSAFERDVVTELAREDDAGSVRAMCAGAFFVKLYVDYAIASAIVVRAERLWSISA